LQFDLAIDVPYIKAALSDAEYALVTSVAAENVGEAPELPEGAQWLAQHYQAAADAAAQAEADAEAEAGAGGAAPEEIEPAAAAAGEAAAAAPAPPPAGAAQDSSRTAVRTVVSLGEVELELLRTVEGLPAPLPLARLAMAHLQVSFRSTEGGSMRVGVCLPKLEVQDLRAEVPREQSLVVSSGHKASFMMLEVRRRRRGPRPQGGAPPRQPARQPARCAPQICAALRQESTVGNRTHPTYLIHAAPSPPPSFLPSVAVGGRAGAGAPGAGGHPAEAAAGGGAGLPAGRHPVCGAHLCVRQGQPHPLRHPRPPARG
jgi:hypothetical protein